MSSDVRLVVVDDDPLVRLGIRLLCESAPGVHVVGEASDGAEALGVVGRIHPDVLLMDVQMRVGGIETALLVRQRHPEVRVVLMSAFVGEGFRQHAFNAGASAFVAKTAPPAVLLQAIHPDAAPQEADDAEEVVASRALSAREAQIALRVAEGWDNERIAESLFLSTNTVKTYVSRVFKKLHVKNRVQLANLMHREHAETGPVDHA